MIPVCFEISQTLIEFNKSSSDHLICMMQLFFVDMQLTAFCTAFLWGLINQIFPDQVTDCWEGTRWGCERNVYLQVLPLATERTTWHGPQFPNIFTFRSHWFSQFTWYWPFWIWHFIFLQVLCADVLQLLFMLCFVLNRVLLCIEENNFFQFFLMRNRLSIFGSISLVQKTNNELLYFYSKWRFWYLASDILFKYWIKAN